MKPPKSSERGENGGSDSPCNPTGATESLEASDALQAQLEEMPCIEQSLQRAAPLVEDGSYSLWHMYERYWRPFGELLTDMEREGMLVNRCPELCAPPLHPPLLDVSFCFWLYL